uniref:COesterase domain-containing protein n=1 Tax=Strongyloides papillosus TaxID=174720 RepID=A0A0N5B2X2_STREA
MNSGRPSTGTLICAIILIIALAVENQKLFWAPPLPVDVPLSIEIPENDIPYTCPKQTEDGEINLLLKPVDVCNPKPNIISNPLNYYLPQKSSTSLDFVKNSTL